MAGNNTNPPIPGSQNNRQNDPGSTAQQPRVARRPPDAAEYGSQDGYRGPQQQAYRPAPPRPQPNPQFQAQPQPAPSQPPKQGSGVWKSILGGALAGAAVSAALFGVLIGTGVVGGKAAPRATTESSAGRTINLSTADENYGVAQVVAAKCLPSVVSVYVNSAEGAGIGSGVVLDTDGNIITNWHVAGEAESISVTIDEQSYDATLVGGDASSDIAVIRAELDGAQVTPMELGDSSALVVGDWVMTLGSPLGLDQSASSGIVSALYRNTLMAASTGNTIYTNLIQVDAAINGGNSGGALVNAEGKLVGINTLYANGSGSEAFAGIGFAIPGNYAVDIANKVIKGEPVTHAYMGVSCATVNAQNAQANHLSVNQGAYVSELEDGGPAAEAGIKVGDIVTKIGKYDVTSADGLVLAVRSYSVGDEVDVTFVRDGEEQTVKVKLGSDETLQAKQEEERKKQEEDLQKQYEEYLNQQQNQQHNQQQSPDQSWPWDTYQWPWELWDWDTDSMSNPVSR